MIEPLHVLSLLLSPCIAYGVGALLFWGIELLINYPKKAILGGHSV